MAEFGIIDQNTFTTSDNIGVGKQRGDCQPLENIERTLKQYFGHCTFLPGQRIARQQLQQVVVYCESSTCCRRILLAHFGETLQV